MLLTEWEIWNTYASFFVEPIQDLEAVAKNLVRAGLLECAFINNGKFFWFNDSEIQSGNAQVTLHPNRSSASFSVNTAIPDGYPGEALFQSMYFRFAELKQYIQHKDFPPSYIRGYLGECRLVADDYTYSVYPIVKLFQTGVLLVELRMINPDKKINVQEFIDEYLSLYKLNFNDVLVPPALRIAAQHEYAITNKPKPSWQVRIGSYLIDRDIKRYVNRNTTREKSGEFEFQFVHLWNIDEIKYKEKDQVDPFTLSDLAHTIFKAISISIPGLRTGKSLLIKPNSPFLLGDFWSGKPHIHILKFHGQLPTAQQNETKFQNEYGWIMSGIYKNDSEIGTTFLPQNSRAFDDYGAYIAEQGTLWAWSKRGIADSKKWEVPNQDHLVYLNQSQCELLEYGHMLHRRLFQLVKNPQSVEATLKARENLLELEAAMSDASGYGEIRNLLIKGWDNLQVNRLQTAIIDMIAIRQTDASIKEGRRVVIWQIIFSFVFGIVAIPGFATGFIEPLWKWLNFWTPTDPNASQVLFFMIALVLVEISILGLIRILSKKAI